MVKIPHFEIAVSHDSDLLISQGPADRLLFVHRLELYHWLWASVRTRFEIPITSLLGVAVGATAFQPGTIFFQMPDGKRPPLAAPEDLCLHFQLENGIRMAYVGRDELIERGSRWFTDAGYYLTAGPNLHSLVCDRDPHLPTPALPIRRFDKWLTKDMRKRITRVGKIEVCAK